jgi:hypothetical protein
MTAPDIVYISTDPHRDTFSSDYGKQERFLIWSERVVHKVLQVIAGGRRTSGTNDDLEHGCGQFDVLAYQRGEFLHGIYIWF